MVSWAWAFVNLKPGTGKSTMAVFTAHELHDRGVDVLLVDADPGGSVSRWADLSGGFPFPVVALPKRTVYRELTTMVSRMNVEAVIIDTPQLEDHHVIAKGAMSYANTWIIPTAPSGVEVDRMAATAEHCADVQAGREQDAEMLVLLNRTNREERTKGGPDAQVAEALTEQGYTVMESQIPHSDTRFRQSFGTWPTSDDAVDDFVDELFERKVQ